MWDSIMVLWYMLFGQKRDDGCGCNDFENVDGCWCNEKPGDNKKCPSCYPETTFIKKDS